MKARLEGIALLKDGTIKISCPMAEGTKLADLDALRGQEIVISVADAAPAFGKPLTVSEIEAAIWRHTEEIKSLVSQLAVLITPVNETYVGLPGMEGEG